MSVALLVYARGRLISGGLPGTLPPPAHARHHLATVQAADGPRTLAGMAPRRGDPTLNHVAVSHRGPAPAKSSTSSGASGTSKRTPTTW